MSSIALVIGAAGGMGRVIAQRLARDWDVVAVGRDRDRLDACTELEGIRTVVADASTEEGRLAVLDGIEELGLLVHAQAIGAPRQPLAEGSAELWREVMEVNVVSTVELTRLALPALRAARGSVVFLNSGAGLRSYAGIGPYSASKFALRTAADTFRQEEARNGVRFTTIYPGRTDTPMLRSGHEAKGWLYDPSEFIAAETIAAAVGFVAGVGPDAHIVDLEIQPRVQSEGDGAKGS